MSFLSVPEVVHQRRRLTTWLVLTLSIPLLCCSAAEPSPARAPTPRGKPVQFEFWGDGEPPLNSERTRGRATALAFVATYDLGSQLLLRRLNDAVRATVPRANGGAVVMEPPSYSVLIPTFRQALGLIYPVAMADHATLNGRGPFGVIDYIPTLVILDRQGREVFRHRGPLELAELRRMLRRAAGG